MARKTALTGVRHSYPARLTTRRTPVCSVQVVSPLSFYAFYHVSSFVCSAGLIFVFSSLCNADGRLPSPVCWRTIPPYRARRLVARARKRHATTSAKLKPNGWPSPCRSLFGVFFVGFAVAEKRGQAGEGRSESPTRALPTSRPARSDQAALLAPLSLGKQGEVSEARH